MTKPDTTITWLRGNSSREGELKLYHDNIIKDLRTVTDIRFTPHRIAINIYHLHQYNKITNCWGNYLNNPISYDLPNRIGESRIRQYIAAIATELHGYPNMQNFTIYTNKIQIPTTPPKSKQPESRRSQKPEHLCLL